jgi:hypothetical protein
MTHIIIIGKVCQILQCDRTTTLPYQPDVEMISQVPFSQIAELTSRYGIYNYPEQQVVAVVMNAVPLEDLGRR